MSKFIKSICDILESGENIALATIISHLGSTPRTSGSKMLIKQDGSIVGTIGGGIVEGEVIKDASGLFSNPKPRINTYNLSARKDIESMDVICGGILNVLIELLDSSSLPVFKNLLAAMMKREKVILAGELGEKIEKVQRSIISGNAVAGNLTLNIDEMQAIKNSADTRLPVIVELKGRQFLVEPHFAAGDLYIFGAGHVGQELAYFANRVDFSTIVLDDREEFCSRMRFPSADELIVLKNFETAFQSLTITSDSYIVIVTRGHSHDRTVLAQALKTNAHYIGMIGSKKKRDTLYAALLEGGFTQKDIDRVHCPIGLEIKAETPAEIAASIVSELILIRAK
jgi:xanthine dehydrogenase accessory factor